jgi:hypothetical protein
MRRNLQSVVYNKAKLSSQPEASLYIGGANYYWGKSRSFDSFETDRLGWQIRMLGYGFNKK